VVYNSRFKIQDSRFPSRGGVQGWFIIQDSRFKIPLSWRDAGVVIPLWRGQGEVQYIKNEI
jgi:hypothetical protein